MSDLDVLKLKMFDAARDVNWSRTNSVLVCAPRNTTKTTFVLHLLQSWRKASGTTSLVFVFGCNKMDTPLYVNITQQPLFVYDAESVVDMLPRIEAEQRQLIADQRNHPPITRSDDGKEVSCKSRKVCIVFESAIDLNFLCRDNQ